MSRPAIAVVGIGGLALALAVASLLCFYDAIPGTFYRDANGGAHGTGWYTYRYQSGAVELIEDYSRGKQKRSRCPFSGPDLSLDPRYQLEEERERGRAVPP